MNVAQRYRRLRIEPSGHDDTRQLQQAIIQLSQLPADDHGWHGALELAAGEFK